MLKVQFGALAVLVLCVSSLAMAGEGDSRAVATEGGYAESIVEGHGDSRVRGLASATRGGRALTQAIGDGLDGGRVDVFANSMADGGTAEASATGRAKNGGYSESTAHAVTINGHSYACDRAYSFGDGDARSITSSFSYRGEALARGGAEADGNGGEATCRNVLHSETWDGRSQGESVARSRAGSGGVAYSEAEVLSFSRNGRTSNARFVSEAEASYNGTAISRGFLRDAR